MENIIPLDKNQRRFFSMLEQFPVVAAYWDKGESYLDVDRLENELGILSSGEQALACFFAAIWLGENKFSFDITEHPRCFDRKAKKIFQEWASNPFYA